MKRTLIKVAIATGVVLVLATPAFFVLHSWMSSSADGTVHAGTPTVHQDKALPQATAPVQLDTPYFTAGLPGNFVVKRQNTPTNGGPILFQLSANTDGKTDEQFGATIGTLPAEGFTGVGDYKLRATSTATYAKYISNSLPSGATAFRTISGPAELTVFWPEGNRYAELSFSTEGAAAESTLQSVLNGVISAWDWK